MFKTPRLKRHLDSPPALDQFQDDSGPPRTPSPSPSPNNQMNYMPVYHQQDKNIIRLNPALFKYQRQETEKKSQSQSRPDQHYKKKFYYREWRDNGNERTWENETEEQADNDNSQKKFQQKPKDWDCYKDMNSGFPVNKVQNDNQWPRNNDVYNVSNNWKN